MEIDVRLVKSFVAVADERSFTRAAERLHVAQPWLSVQIRKLEEQLGFRLFERNRNQAVVPSPEAEAFLPAARDYLVSVERVTGSAKRIRDQATVVLRLGAPDFSADMPMRSSVLDGFLAGHPKFEIEVSNAWTIELLRRLRDGEIDMAFTVGPHVDPQFEAVVLARYRLSLLMPADRVAAHDAPLPLSALTGSQVAIFRRNINPAFYDSIAPVLEAAGVIVAQLPESGIPAMLHYAQRTGMPSLVGDWHARMSNIPDSLVVVPLDESALSFNLNLVRRLGDRRAPISALWDFAMSRMRAYTEKISTWV